MSEKHELTTLAARGLGVAFKQLQVFTSVQGNKKVEIWLSTHQPRVVLGSVYGHLVR